MRRRALLIGNSRGLQGVKKDIVNFQKFLISSKGGCWYRNEIVILMNPTKVELENEIRITKEQEYDFVITLFSGHGGYQRGTILEINGNDETIMEKELWGLAQRQISIFDCCRAYCSYEDSDKEIVNEMRTFSQGGSVISVRCLYDLRMMEACPQQNRLYACAIGEAAHDNPEEGAYYLKNLILKAKHCQDDYGLVGNIHEDAAQATTMEVQLKEGATQHPSASIPRFLSSQQLILSINM